MKKTEEIKKAEKIEKTKEKIDKKVCEIKFK